MDSFHLFDLTLPSHVEMKLLLILVSLMQIYLIHHLRKETK